MRTPPDSKTNQPDAGNRSRKDNQPVSGRNPEERKKPFPMRNPEEKSFAGRQSYGGKKPFYDASKGNAPQGKPPVELTIDRLDDRFAGVAYIGKDRYAVEGGLPKEKVLAKVIKTEFGVRYAGIVKVLEPSPFRTEPACPVYRNCGGCALLHLRYEEELRQKTAFVRKKLAPLRFSQVEDEEELRQKTAFVRKKLAPLRFFQVEDCVASEKEGFASRNKVHIAFSSLGKELCVGFFDQTTHRVVNVPACPMHGDWYIRLARILKDWVSKFDIEVYDPKTNKGHLRFAAARYLNGFMMLTVVTASQKLGALSELYNMLRISFPRLSLWKNINAEQTNEVMAGQLFHVAGDRRLSGEMMGLRYQLSPDSFFQVNEGIAEKVYQKVFGLLRESGIANVIDLYSGIGITSALLAKAGYRVTSIEIEPAAVQDAKALCAANGITGVTHLCGDVSELLPSLRSRQGTKQSETPSTTPSDPSDQISPSSPAKSEETVAFFVDPPRAGLGEEVCKELADFAPAMILYLSCNPASLAADLETLLSAGYQIESATPYDMFPHSRHLETLVCMTRK